MEEKLIELSRIVAQAKFLSFNSNEIPDGLRTLYDNMVKIAVKQDVFIKYNDGFYPYEKLYFDSEGVSFCWAKIYSSETIIYVFEVSSGSSYPIVKFEGQAE